MAIWALNLALAAYVALFLFGLLLSEPVIFQPHSASYRDDNRILKLTSADGRRISALYLANPAATYTLLFSHGNAEDLGDLLPLLRAVHDAGFAVLAYDYQGYGTSEGRPSEQSLYQDEEAAYQYLTGPLGDRFRNLEKMARVRCPVLVIHGEADPVVPFWHGRKLYAAAHEPKQALWVAGGGHNDLAEVAGARYFRALRAFANSLAAEPAAAPAP